MGFSYVLKGRGKLDDECPQGNCGLWLLGFTTRLGLGRAGHYRFRIRRFVLHQASCTRHLDFAEVNKDILFFVRGYKPIAFLALDLTYFGHDLRPPFAYHRE